MEEGGRRGRGARRDRREIEAGSHLQDLVDLNVDSAELRFQMLSLFNTINGAFYLLHFSYNISHTKNGAIYHVLCIIPIVLTVLMTPVTVMEFTMAKAFVTPSPDIIDKVLSAAKAAE